MTTAPRRSAASVRGAGKDLAPADEALVAAALDGDRDALEALLRRHQGWVYNVALRMVWQPEDARDVTQEVLIRAFTKLSTFRGEAAFRTWLGRITVRTVLGMRRRGSERSVTSFAAYGQRIAACPDAELPDPRTVPVDAEVLVGEAKVACTTGMLLCLDREQRLAFILGAILQVGHREGAAMMEVSPPTFRQRLARARRDLERFMAGQCGLVDPRNPCRCARKTRAFIDRGVVDPVKLRFVHPHLRQVRQVAPRRTRRIERSIEVFREHPYQGGPDVAGAVGAVLAALAGGSAAREGKEDRTDG